MEIGYIIAIILFVFIIYMASKYLYQYHQCKNEYIALKNIQSGGKYPSKNLSQSNNILNFKLSDNMEKNSVYSPTSILFALSLIHLAAQGNTDKELTKLLGHKYTANELENLYGLFNNDIVKLSNALLLNKTKKINKQYLDEIKNVVLISIDDFSNTKNIVNKVNNYIKTKTNGMIRDVIKENDIDVSTILVLINTIYFKANWLHRFSKSLTQKMQFNGDKVQQIDMMYQKENFDYFENNDIQMLEMKYRNEDYCMGIILPKTNNKFKLTINKLNEYTANLRNEKVKIYIPKFTHKKNIQLVPILQKLGVNDLFNSNAKLDIAEYAYVSRIIHEAVVVVDEEGTEASAATVVIMKEMATMPREEIIFKANHSFAYYIVHKPTNTILFYGDFRGN